MRNAFIYLLGLLLIASCTDNSEQEGKSLEDLPEGKWNGEYMEVESEDEDKKRPSKKSNGSEILNLGKVVYTIGENKDDIIQFDKRKNDITINENQIAIRIKDANDRFFLIGLHKDQIFKNPEGKYIDVANQKNNAPKFSLNFQADSDSMNNNFQCTEGTLKVKKLNLKSGEVLISAEGKLQNLKDLQEGTSQPFQIDINMTFETVVSAFNPNK
jgi:lipopolysaccharide export LptBFGC system permease protein LptF